MFDVCGPCTTVYIKKKSVYRIPGSDDSCHFWSSTWKIKKRIYRMPFFSPQYWTRMYTPTVHCYHTKQILVGVYFESAAVTVWSKMSWLNSYLTCLLSVTAAHRSVYFHCSLLFNTDIYHCSSLYCKGSSSLAEAMKLWPFMCLRWCYEERLVTFSP